MGVLLSVDLGTSAVKVLAVTATGAVQSFATAGYELRTPEPGRVEQDPADWWAAVQQALVACLERVPGGAAAVDAISFSGHMSGLVLVDAAGEALAPCIMLADLRSAPQADRLRATLGERVLRLTGNQPLPAFLAPKLLWVKEHAPALYSRAAGFLMPKDFIRARFTGGLCTEPTDAGSTLVLDPVRGTWDVDLCREMGLDPRLLPELRRSVEVVGTVTAEAAAATGLLAGTPVVAGAGDMACSAIGTGAVVGGVVAVTISTAAQVLTAVDRPLAAGWGKLTFHPHAVPGTLYALGSVFTGGLGLRWLSRLLADADLGRLSALAAEVPPGAGGVVFLPFLSGSGSPQWYRDASASFLGLRIGTGRGHIVRAVMEGVAYNLRENLEVLRSLGVPVQRVHLGGGGSASPVWRSLMAGVLGTAVHPCLEREAAGIGAAALAGVGVGVFAGVREAAQALARTGEPVRPDAAEVARYQEMYAVYQHVQSTLNGLFPLLAR